MQMFLQPNAAGENRNQQPMHQWLMKTSAKHQWEIFREIRQAQSLWAWLLKHKIRGAMVAPCVFNNIYIQRASPLAPIFRASTTFKWGETLKSPFEGGYRGMSKLTTNLPDYYQTSHQTNQDRICNSLSLRLFAEKYFRPIYQAKLFLLQLFLFLKRLQLLLLFQGDD